MITTVDQKGNVPLPEPVLRASDIRPGDELDISAEDGTIILRKPAPIPTDSLLNILRALKGLPVANRTCSPVRDVPL
jgi:AbrB family looped-hinge helix DNA binding protein